MELTFRELVTALHGMLFGGFFLMALFGVLVLLLDRQPTAPTPRWQSFYLVAMTVFGWAAVLSGAYIIYPWYRAVAPTGADLSLYPKFLLTAHPSTAGWHSLGMEWKEHVAWLCPISITMVAFVFIRYGRELSKHKQLRTAVLGFAAASFLAAAIAGFFGAMIDKHAPVQGGPTIQLTRGAEK